jgi:hypothetical protein
LIAPRSVGDSAEGKVMTFDYTAAAELFIPKKGGPGARQPLSYRRLGDEHFRVPHIQSFAAVNGEALGFFGVAGWRHQSAAKAGEQKDSMPVQ